MEAAAPTSAAPQRRAYFPNYIVTPRLDVKAIRKSQDFIQCIVYGKQEKGRRRKRKKDNNNTIMANNNGPLFTGVHDPQSVQLFSHKILMSLTQAMKTMMMMDSNYSQRRISSPLFYHAFVP
jgi:hypothetical protein